MKLPPAPKSLPVLLAEHRDRRPFVYLLSDRAQEALHRIDRQGRRWLVADAEGMANTGTRGGCVPSMPRS